MIKVFLNLTCVLNVKPDPFFAPHSSAPILLRIRDVMFGQIDQPIFDFVKEITNDHAVSRLFRQ